MVRAAASSGGRGYMRSDDGVIAPDGVVVLGMAAAMFTMVIVRFCGGCAGR